MNKVVYDVLVNDAWVKENFGDCLHKKGDFDYEIAIGRGQWNEIKPRLRYCFAGSPYDGMRVNDIGFWNLVNDRVGNQGYEFIAAGGGYYSNTINWNAAEAFPYMVTDFTASDREFWTLTEGYDQLAMALAHRVLDDGRAELWTGNRLSTFKPADESERRYTLTFYNARDDAYWCVHTDNIILAMPTRSLELLDQHDFFFNLDKRIELQRNIDAVIRQPSFKLLMGFEEPWWHELTGAHAGESITDLPMRQCYYFGVDTENHHSLFLASYNDMRTVPFWNVLADQQHGLFQARATALVSEDELDPWASDQAPQVLVDEAMKQVRELHGSDSIPDPYVTYFKDWGADPYGGGYHAWRAHVDVEATMKYMRQPDPNERVFICGEAYSDQQGWVEGALLCRRAYAPGQLRHLAWPESWLRKDYYLGW